MLRRIGFWWCDKELRLFRASRDTMRRVCKGRKVSRLVWGEGRQLKRVIERKQWVLP